MSSLLILSAVGNLGKKGIIAIIHHSDCGLASINDEKIKSDLLGSLDEGVREGARKVIDGMVFGGIER